ncbi:MAG: DUF5805 domain-containing protein [Halorientalis sp.]
MATEGDSDTFRTAVRTYVPAYQKETWERQAEELDMSLSEFVRTMVQAGRRGFAGGQTPDGDHEHADADDTGIESNDDLEARVVSALAESEPLSWDELLAAVTGDIESALDDTLQRMQAANRIQYSGRDGGYVRGDR